MCFLVLIQFVSNPIRINWISMASQVSKHRSSFSAVWCLRQPETELRARGSVCVSHTSTKKSVYITSVHDKINTPLKKIISLKYSG